VSEDLIRELARDLEPVQPIPRIRTVMAGVIVLWLAVTAVGLSMLGLRPDLIEAIVAARGVAVVLVGLGLAGLGGVAAAAAMGVPGRELLARGALGASIFGVAVAAGVGVLLFATQSAAGAGSPVSSDLRCLTVAVLVGLLPAGGVVWFAGRSAPRRPTLLVLVAAVATAALGAITAYASCSCSDMRHLMVAHALAPAFGALLLTLPILVVLKRLGHS
jgi:hypothetical protein